MNTPGPDETDAVADPPQPPVTGDEQIDAALLDLRSAVASANPDDSVGAFEAVHRTLQTRLSDVEG